MSDGGADSSNGGGYYGGEGSGGMGSTNAGSEGEGGAAPVSGNNSNDNGGLVSATMIITDNEMNPPYNVAARCGPTLVDHDHDHDDTVDRPLEKGYSGDRLATSSPRVPYIHTDRPPCHRHTSLDLDDYFIGPRDIQKHSKWPLFLQMHGSILPKMVLPLIAVGLWATTVTCVSYFSKVNLGISSILLTVTGFVVGLCLSFRSSTAYERYAEGRRYWAQLILASHSLGRVFWVHAIEREGENKEKDILSKLTALNLLVAFSVALKHKLRFEPYTGYEDLVHLVGHLDTYANEATIKEPEKVSQARPTLQKVVGEYLGVSFAASNPRKAIKNAGHTLGNLPLELLTYLACFVDELVANNQLVVPMHQTLAYNNIAVLNDVMMGTERVLTTPLPIAYSIAISQITWIYVMLLPFQLYSVLRWVTIPATLAASYIILGILFIGREIENPFGQDVNDLPLESYCAQVACELDIIASKKKHRNRDWVESLDNKVLYPLSLSGWHVWKQRSEAKLREALKQKAEISTDMRKSVMGHQGGRAVLGQDEEEARQESTAGSSGSILTSPAAAVLGGQARYGRETV